MKKSLSSKEGIYARSGMGIGLLRRTGLLDLSFSGFRKFSAFSDSISRRKSMKKKFPLTPFRWQVLIPLLGGFILTMLALGLLSPVASAGISPAHSVDASWTSTV